MIVKKITLNNIRSYTDASVEFPESSVLLSGDIGCGKSTILLALEFALFGLSKGDVSGESLLRNGKSKGSVEVSLNIQGRDIVIKRTLKKTADKVSQDSGYIIENETRKDATAVELKSRIISLLGYPKEALTKKSLIYRYTVYTPQEEMKRILVDDKDYRMDTLRKVFGIDKYKKIKENASVYLRALKEKSSNYQGQVEDLDVLGLQFSESKQKFAEIDSKIKLLKPEHDKFKSEFQVQKLKVQELEQKARDRQECQHKLQLSESKLKDKLEQRKRNSRESELIVMRTDELTKELEAIKLDKPELTSEQINKVSDDKQKELLELSYELKEVELKKIALEEENKQVSELNKCPTCKQEVKSDYKAHFTKLHSSEIETLTNQFNRLGTQKKMMAEYIEKLKSDSYNAHKKERDYLVMLNNKKHISSMLNEMKLKTSQIEISQAELKKEIGQLNLVIVELSGKLTSFAEVNIEGEKKLLDAAMQSLHAVEVKMAEQEREKTLLEKDILLLKTRIDEKLKIKDKIKQLNDHYSWLDSFFIPLMSTMEKHVMVQVHKEFDSLFQEWFDVLLNDDNVSVRLDDNFTPIIEQNGYELDISNMSGGEKTAVALTYRLALNKVINDLITTINTRDILILDEPTDGFSTEQLDRVRDVLDKLNLKQVILVSHESKIESFVDKVIRINKNEHISEVVV
jgi:exonuclease SbcC